MDGEEKRKILRRLAWGDDAEQIEFSNEMVAWLRASAIAGLGAIHFPNIPELKNDYFLTVGENSVHIQLLTDALATLDGLPVVLLKGVALLADIFKDDGARTMNDIDIWILPEYVEEAVRRLRLIGYWVSESEDRPLALQLESDGEITLKLATFPRNFIELHLSIFVGWWLQLATNTNAMDVWERKVALSAYGAGVFQLSPEDTILHFAIHNTVNHQLSVNAVRAFIDTAVTARQREIDWVQLATRARQWKVATATWLHLYFTDQTVSLPEVKTALSLLEPRKWQRRLLLSIVDEEAALDPVLLDRGPFRYVFLFLLTDRPIDSVRLVFRALWPEKSWLIARYGSPRRWHHLWQVVRFGRI